MRLKEANNKIAHIAWSPSTIYPSYIASGTAAEQFDSSFSTKSSLDLLKLDLTNPSTELELSGSIVTEARFSKLIWSNYETSNSKNLIIGGCENSNIYLFDHEKIISTQDPNASSACVVQTLQKHTGSVLSLDTNPFQHNLLASGAGSSEIFVWDLNNPNVPMTPGAKIQPLDDINCVSWNNQVQHILASTCSGKCVVWDLRKNESIIKVSDNMSKMRAKLVTWHPDVATQMCLSSDDDHTPYLQLWDLRFATSPVRILEGHTRGILALSWCANDSNLLLSSAKDNRIICWNPNNPTVNGEILYDLPTVGQWCFDLSWCKRSPDLVAASSFEGQVNVYSLMGGKYNIVHQTSSKIMDSFGDTVPSTPPATSNQQQTTQIIPQLKLAPKWMKRTCGATFGFGGKLVTFGHIPNDSQQSEQLIASNNILNQRVSINQVTTDHELVEKSQYFEMALQQGKLFEYCTYKAENVDPSQVDLWKFISATFHKDKNQKFIELLGFNEQSVEAKLTEKLNSTSQASNQSAMENNLNHDSNELNSHFDKSLNLNNNEHHLFEQFTSNADNQISLSPINLEFSNDSDNLISELLLLGRFESAVDICVQENRFTDALLIANFFDQKLFLKVQQNYFKKNPNKFSSLLNRFLNRDWYRIVTTCNLQHWKEALIMIMTYTQNEELASLCDALGARLEGENYLMDACICYVCSSNLDNFVSCWQKLIVDLNSSASLQDTIEKATLLRYALKNVHPELSRYLESKSSSPKLNETFVKYAKLLADQGCFLSAYNYINDLNDQSILIMKDRIFNALDKQLVQQCGLKKPECPFKAQQQIYSKISSNQANMQTGYHHAPHHSSTSNVLSRKSSSNYPSHEQTLAQPTTQANNSNPYSNHLNNNFLPITPMNHPMPTSNIISNSIRSSTPAAPTLPTKPPTYSQSSAQPAPPSFPSASTGAPSYAPPLPQNSQLNQPRALYTPAPPATTTQNLQPTGFYSPSENTAPANPTPAFPSYMHTKPATAWNDPPIVAPKVKAPPSSQTAPAEMPTFFQPTIAPVQPPSMPTAGSYYQPQQPVQPQMPTYQPPSVNPPQPTGHFQQNNFNTFNPSAQAQTVERATPVSQAQLVEKPTAVVEKGPIPSEHQIIQTVFDTLLNKCLMASNTPTYKRKLEDVGKKLEVLYDKLRSSTLSPTVLQGVHSMVQYVQAFDFQSVLVIHSQIVATSNFSEISGFMPGIKVLIQSCQQFNITL